MIDLKKLDQWNDMWNGAFDLADELCSPEFSIFFGRDASTHNGDDITNAAQLKTFMRDFRASLGDDLAFTLVRTFADADAAFAVSLWNLRVGPDRTVGGIDVFQFDEAGRIRRVHSVTGQRGVIE
ncbi:nuclear transport factor 2 family protein [Streptomyces sp. NBC_00588]|uniref:nuclear transport factor 2 family protein n=1 Tax=Streptomyces sp. NBC_00588 TaxID=2975784 RepID=UPI002E810EE6|nr:nuclear transport factor 2 family protein [Streptomyces sp. NBC_00588]WUB38773.1 nuclear transport factor 2 family protein [Streptomyces sp. NBC_00588]